VFPFGDGVTRAAAVGEAARQRGSSSQAAGCDLDGCPQQAQLACGRSTAACPPDKVQSGRKSVAVRVRYALTHGRSI
jgi:hypothetical protein